MKGAFLTLGSLTLLVASLACIGSDQQPGLTSSDPRSLLDQARTAVAELDSYHIAFIFPARPEDVREEYRWEIEFDAPDSYRFLLFGAEGETKKVCESYISPDGRGQGETCYEVVTSITKRTLTETILVGDKAYGRQCDATGEECEPWQERPRGPIAIAGPSPSYFPQWPLVAMELAEELELAGEDKVDGAVLIRVRGSVNHLRAIFENERRVLTAAGITSFGEECTVEAREPGEPPGEESCREVTFEEYLKQQEPQLSFYDEQPAVIDIWVSPEDFLVHHIALIASPPPGEPGAWEGAFTMEYSLLNQVQIEAPR